MKDLKNRIDYKVLNKITDSTQERNIYVHTNPLARDIFWQRLDILFAMLKKHVKSNDTILDFGGGSGVFSYYLASYFMSLDIVDLDCDDAMKIKDYFNLKNINIFEKNIENMNIDIQYSIVTATDVLEHFENQNVPLAFLDKVLKKDGLLAITLPTENWIYALGRKIIQKEKPLDHYHSSYKVIENLKNNGYEIIEKTFLPKYLISIPLFEAVILRKKI